MSEIAVVSKSHFGRGGTVFSRLDPEYVRADFVDLEADLEKIGARTTASVISEVASIAEESGLLRYVAIDEVDTDDGLLLSDEILAAHLPSRAQWLLQVGDVVVSNVRPNRGAVGFVTTRNAGAIGSSGLTVVRVPATTGLAPEYVFAFFRTIVARMQLLRRNRGSMYPAVLSSDVFEVLIPTAPENIADEVVQAVRRAVSHWETFFSQHDEATTALQALLASVPAPPSPVESSQGISVTEVMRTASLVPGSAERIDAEFFRADFAKCDAALRTRFETFTLGQRYDLATGSGVKRSPEEDNVVFVVKQAVLSNVGVNWSAIQVEPGRIPAIGDVEEGDILLACTAHEVFYVGRKVDYVRVVPAEYKRNVAVADVLILRPQEGNTLPGAYVAAFLRSDWGRHQVQRCIRGLRGGHVYGRDLAVRVRVPIPPEPWLTKYEAASEAAEGARNSAKAEVGNAVRTLDTWLRGKVSPKVSAAIERQLAQGTPSVSALDPDPAVK